MELFIKLLLLFSIACAISEMVLTIIYIVFNKNILFKIIMILAMVGMLNLLLITIILMYNNCYSILL